MFIAENMGIFVWPCHSLSFVFGSPPKKDQPLQTPDSFVCSASFLAGAQGIRE